jgi:hypothetical protein
LIASIVFCVCRRRLCRFVGLSCSGVCLRVWQVCSSWCQMFIGLSGWWGLDGDGFGFGFGWEFFECVLVVGFGCLWWGCVGVWVAGGEVL